MKEMYITGIGAVAPQETLNRDNFLRQVNRAEGHAFEIVKPDYKSFIPAKALRRMSKIVRMGVTAAKSAMEDAGIEQPDAIITATGMGSQKDTEKVLNGMIQNNESMINPTAFMQSTHNTVGAQIALGLGNKNYNFTFVHRTFSFESALIDAQMLLAEEGGNILTGGIDEITEESRIIKSHIGYYKKEPLQGDTIFDDRQPGAFPGEGTGFFVLSDKPGNKNYGKIKAVKTFFRPESFEVTRQKTELFLKENGYSGKIPDLILMGYNGDPGFDPLYSQLEEALFPGGNVAPFKHLCGEFDTATAFARWIAARVLDTGSIPDALNSNGKNPKGKPGSVLIYNHFRNVNHSLILLER